MIERIVDYRDRVDELITQYQNSENLKGIISGRMAENNRLETAIFEMLNAFFPESISGDQLDIIGKIFDIARSGQLDPDYIQSIMGKAAGGKSGDINSIIAIIKTVFGATSVRIKPYFPGKYLVLTDGSVTAKDLRTYNIAGVEGMVEKFLTDGQGRYIVDGQGRFITTTLELKELNITDSEGRFITDGEGRYITTKKAG